MSNGKSKRPGLPSESVRALLRVVNELHALPCDPLLRKLRLLERLCSLVRAGYGDCTVAHAEGEWHGRVVSIARTGEAVPEAFSQNGRLRRSGEAKRAGTITSTISLPGRQLMATVTLARAAGSRKAFTPRDRGIVALLHEETAWVYGFDLPLASPEVASLPPRQRQTLQLLLAGRSEKQAASQLDVSTNTVHHYVKAIYRHFRVNSRSELLAKWVKSDQET